MVARRFRILVCRGPECGDRRGSSVIHGAFVRALGAAGAADRCELDSQSCFGRCSQGPNALVRELPAGPVAPPRFALADLPPGRGGGPRLATALYSRLDLDKVEAIVLAHVVGGRIVPAYIQPPAPPAATPVATSAPAVAAPVSSDPSGDRDV